MSLKKRSHDDGEGKKRKKQKIENENAAASVQPVTSVLSKDEVDFPRGGGSSFTPAEYKQIRAEAIKELKDEVFKDTDSAKKRSKSKGTRAKTGSLHEDGRKGKGGTENKEKTGDGRIEHLNYKRITVGMKIFCQVMAIYPLALIVSLPDQLLGHVPITQISDQLTAALEAADEDEDVDSGASDDEETNDVGRRSLPPDLLELFQPGQFVSAVVTAVKPPGTTEGGAFSYARDEMEKTSRRVELSLVPSQNNAGLSKADLKPGLTLNASVRSVEDHGYILDIGAPEGVSGFLPFKKSGKLKSMPAGSLLRATVDKLAEDGRTCTFSADEQLLRTSLLKEVSNVSSLLPGLLVQALITSVSTFGLNVEVLGSFSGTIDLYQVPGGDLSPYSAGKKVKARILYQIAGSSPPQFALAISDHITSLHPKTLARDSETLADGFPIGTQLQATKVKRVESERGLVVEVRENVDGFVHISHVSDEHVPSLSTNSGKWKIGSVHAARVIGHHPFDGILQLSMRSSVLEQKFLRVDDVQVGELVKGKVRKLTDSSLFVRINGNVDGMIWPTHYADIMLKHPQKRFKKDVDVKCRVLTVDASRKRILLTAKKSLVESDLPIISRIEDAKVDLVTVAVICKVLEKCLIVEFFNNIRGIIPAREASETPPSNLSEGFSVGKPVKIRVTHVDPSSSRIVASIRKLTSEAPNSVSSIEKIEVGQMVSGTVSEISGENVRLLLHPNNARALMSLKNVANNRGTTVDQLRTSLMAGEEMNDLIVVSRNIEKGFLLVANKPSKVSQKAPRQPPLDIKTIVVGSRVTGQVDGHARSGAFVKFPGSGKRVVGMLHRTDISDDYSEGSALPAIGSVVEAFVVAVDKEKRQVSLSTRRSRASEAESVVVDSEVKDINDLKVDTKIRGFIKSIADHGIFVTIARDIDARVQIKELYDEFVKDWKKGFVLDQVVEGKITHVNPAKRQVEMSFRSGPTKKELSLSDLEVGQKVNGTVKRVTDFGVFVIIEHSKVTGLCHKSEIADNESSDVVLAMRNFHEGDSVKAIVLKVDTEKKQVSLSLKPSHFSSDDLSEEHVQEAENVVEDIEMKDAEENEEEESSDERISVDEDAIQPISLQTETPTQRAAPQTLPVLSLQGGFQWHGMPDSTMRQGEDTDDSSDEDGDLQEHKKKKLKKAIEYDVTGEMHSKLPDSVSDFERRLLGSPNSSYLWIQYMSFQLQLSEVDKAREIGRRAIKTINIREEQEKLNVWIAMLNMENAFGTEASLESAFKEAARMCDSKTVHLRLATILDESQKKEKAEEQFKRTCKKFGQSSKVWTSFGEHYLKRGKVEEARALIPRSYQSLEKRKHFKTISKFAQLEYKHGEPEYGKTLFEGIIDLQPKRFDLWSVYMDMEAAQKDIQSLRNLFERVLSIKMTSHKAKAFFKKWLSLEQRIGDQEGQEAVKQKAIEWTQRTANHE